MLHSWVRGSKTTLTCSPSRLTALVPHHILLLLVFLILSSLTDIPFLFLCPHSLFVLIPSTEQLISPMEPSSHSVGTTCKTHSDYVGMGSSGSWAASSLQVHGQVISVSPSNCLALVSTFQAQVAVSHKTLLILLSLYLNSSLYIPWGSAGHDLSLEGKAHSTFSLFPKD